MSVNTNNFIILGKKENGGIEMREGGGGAKKNVKLKKGRVIGKRSSKGKRWM